MHVFAKIDILRGLTYVATAVPLAYLGCKSWSFIGAITLSTIVKAWVAFREAPWPVRFQTAPQGNEAYPSLWYHFPAVHLDVSYFVTTSPLFWEGHFLEPNR